MKAHMEHLSFCLTFINIMIFRYIHFPTDVMTSFFTAAQNYIVLYVLHLHYSVIC